MSKGNFSIRIWLRKGAEIFIAGGLGAVIAYCGGLPQTETVLVTVAALRLILNWIKHR